MWASMGKCTPDGAYDAEFHEASNTPGDASQSLNPLVLLQLCEVFANRGMGAGGGGLCAPGGIWSPSECGGPVPRFCLAPDCMSEDWDLGGDRAPP